MPQDRTQPVTSLRKLRATALRQGRVRITGTVVERGYGWSGRYRQSWLNVRATAGTLRVTASLSSPLGTMPVGSSVVLEARLTGMVDLTADLYYAERARLIASSASPADLGAAMTAPLDVFVDNVRRL